MKALILSGGGAKGAFSIGALKEIRKRRGNLDFDIISGTSTGSLIATLLAAGMLDKLEEIYKTVDNGDIVNQQNILQNIRNNFAFLLDDSPLRAKIDGVLTEAVALQILNSHVTLLLTAVSLKTGKITVFSNKAITASAGSKRNFVQVKNRKELIDAMSASSNQFAFMPPVPIDVGGGAKEQMIDGGVRDTLPTNAIFESTGDPDEIMVISNNPMELFEEPDFFVSPITALLRGISIFIQDVRENDVETLNAWEKRTGKKYILITPSEDLDPANPTGLRFERQRMADMMLTGERRAKRKLDEVESGVLASRSARSGSRGLILPSKAKPKRKPKTKAAVKPKKTASTKQTDRCKGITADGKPCKNHVTGRAKYCHLHRRA